jgi:ATP-binding cassette subfamily B protein
MAEADPAVADEARPGAPEQPDDDVESGLPAAGFHESELWETPAEKPLRQLPAVAASAIRFVWQADQASFLLATAHDVVSGLTAGLQVLVVGALLDRLIDGGPPEEAVRAAAPFVVLYVAAQLVSSLFGALVEGRDDLYQERVRVAAERRILDVAAGVDLLAFESPTFFDRLQRVQAQAMFRPIQVVRGTNQLISGMAGSIGVIAALFVIQPWLVVALALIYLPIAVVMNRGAWMQYQFVLGVSELERRRAYVSGLLTGRTSAKEVRAFGLRGFFLGRYERLAGERMTELRAVCRRWTRMMVATEGAAALLNGAVLGTVLWLVGRGELTIAAAGAALAGLTQLRARFGGMSYGVAGLYEAVLFLHDQEELLAMAADLRERRPSGAAPADFTRLTAEGVRFRYPEAPRDALRDVTIELHTGQVVALVGENGSGKTTLAKLLGGLYPPTSGAVRWDGIDASTVDPDALHRLVTVVFQDFEKYNFTAADNIGLGDVARFDDRAAIEAAARQAGADRVIRRLAEGYDTTLGRLFASGQDLSIGQWQRVALARAFFRDAPVVVLDEPTSALDARAEHDLFERIRDLLRGRTVLLVSHRFSTVRTADYIYVLHHGRVVEQGTHDDLMSRPTRYADLFRLQASAYLDPA